MYRSICYLVVGMGIGALLVQWTVLGGLTGVLPFFLALLCPLMMVFVMHGMHSSHSKPEEEHKHNH